MEDEMRTDEFNNTILPMRGELKGLACRLAGDTCTAEDMVQEVMLRLWSMRDSLDTDGHNRALAFTILRNLAADRRRHGRYEQGCAATYEPAADYSDALEARDEADLVRRIVDTLPALQRMIFRMKEIEGYDASEIMQITGCSAENLRKNLSRARMRIREEFVRLTAERRT